MDRRESDAQAAADYTAVGFWAPRSFGYWLCRPRLWRAVGHRPVAVRFAQRERWPYESTNVVRWTYDPSLHSRRMCIEFADPTVADLWRFRWRTLANALWKLVDACPRVTFHDVPVDISDCADGSLPPEVFRFAKLPDDPHDLLPNPYLIERDGVRFAARRWQRKADAVFFRGAATGSGDYDRNSRVAACLAARSIKGGDCKLTSFPDVGREFEARARADGITARRTTPRAMGNHRYLLEVDGHTSSWDRFRRIGACGAVPIRFETRWREYWHDQAVEGDHFVSANRSNIASVVGDLRDSPARAQEIAARAASFATEALGVERVQAAFHRTWLARIGSSGRHTA